MAMRTRQPTPRFSRARSDIRCACSGRAPARRPAQPLARRATTFNRDGDLGSLKTLVNLASFCQISSDWDCIPISACWRFQLIAATATIVAVKAACIRYCGTAQILLLLSAIEFRAKDRFPDERPCFGRMRRKYRRYPPFGFESLCEIG